VLVVLSQTNGWIAGVMRWKVLRGLGTISYCVYVVHDTFNILAHRVLLHAEPQVYNAKGVGVTLLSLVLTVVVASVSWRYFSKPLIRRGHACSYWGEEEMPRASLWGLEAH
jgi:peptidoglycan/LPS O-acetylase OafA/YrhL